MRARIGPDLPGTTGLNTAAIEVPKSDTPDIDVPSGQRPHLNNTEIEPGVVAKAKLGEGHTVKILRDGSVIRCSNCTHIRTEYAVELADPKNQALAKRLEQIEQVENPQVKAEQASRLVSDLDGLRKTERTLSGTDQGATTRPGKILDSSGRPVEEWEIEAIKTYGVIRDSYTGKYNRSQFIKRYKKGLTYNPKTKSWSERNPATKTKTKARFPDDKNLTPEQVLTGLKRGKFADTDVELEDSSFGNYLDMLSRKGIADESQVLKDLTDQLKTTPAAGRTLELVRHSLKEKYATRILDEMTDATKLKQKYPELWKNDATTALNKARHRELLDVVKDLYPADKGNIAEKWYQKVFAGDAAVHVSVKKDYLKALLGDDIISKNRVLDLLNDGTLIEIKTIKGPVGAHDKSQFNDFMELVRNEVSLPINSGTAVVKVERAKYVFPVPEGVKANAEWMKDMLAKNRNLDFEIFSASGNKIIVNRKNISFLDSPSLDKFLEP